MNFNPIAYSSDNYRELQQVELSNIKLERESSLLHSQATIKLEPMVPIAFTTPAGYQNKAMVLLSEGRPRENFIEYQFFIFGILSSIYFWAF